MSRLLEISSAPLSLGEPLCHSQDISQVHAINVLRILVQDSSLVTAISRQYATLTIQALNGFTSPVWAVRNASLQLLGLLVLVFHNHIIGFASSLLWYLCRQEGRYPACQRWT